MNSPHYPDTRQAHAAGPLARIWALISTDAIRVIPQSFRWRLFAWLGALHLLFAATGADGLAQPNTRPRASNSSNGISLDMNGWIAESVMLFLAICLAFAVMFLVFYPMLLRKDKPWWPMNAYGVCLAIAFTLSCVAALAIFWEDLVLKGTQQGGPVGIVEQYGLRGGFGAIWLVISGIILSVFRSSKGRATTR